MGWVAAIAAAAARIGEAHLQKKLNMVVSELKLSVRANNCLEAAQIRTVRDLVQRTEDQLLEFRNFGETTLTEVREKLTALRTASRYAAPIEPSDALGIRL